MFGDGPDRGIGSRNSIKGIRCRGETGRASRKRCSDPGSPPGSSAAGSNSSTRPLINDVEGVRGITLAVDGLPLAIVA